MMRPVSFFFLIEVRGLEDEIDCCEVGATSSISYLRGELVGWIWLDALNEVAGVLGKLRFSGIGG